MWNPMSRTSGHVLTTNIMNNTERTVVSTRTLKEQWKDLIINHHDSVLSEKRYVMIINYRDENEILYN